MEKQLRTAVKLFVSKFIYKWKKSRKFDDRFLKQNAEWLKGLLRLPHQTNVTLDQEKVTVKGGRPKTKFVESSERTKQREVRPLTSQIPPETLVYAAESSLVKSGQRNVAKIVKLAVSATPKQLKNMKDAYHSPSSSGLTAYSANEALVLIIDLGLSKEDYINIQRGAKIRGANIYPPYNAIASLKKECYPPNMTITETVAHIPLNDLLDLTIKRLVKVQTDVLMQHVPDDVTNINVFYKWGLDGSGGHSLYKQNFSNNSVYADSNIILCTIVPLEMSVEIRNTKKNFWKNISPSSTRYCRPIGFKLSRETSEVMKTEFQAIESQIRELKPTEIHINSDKILFFNHIPICTMIDGKTCNVLTDTASTQACNVCGVTPKDINNLSKVLERPCNLDSYRFGLSVLHAYLRCYEFLLHISYKIEIKQWQVKGSEAKERVKTRKNTITTLFYREIGLVVDQPKQGGGNSNDGNTARKFFDNPAKVSEITGLDSELICRFANILSALSSGHYINIQEFKFYCLETAQMCIQLYGWYKMSATVHKLLIHGSDIINSLPLPVGQLSEDVLEASHKEYKNFRLFFSRKTSRINTNRDILNRMIVSSDPIISSHRKTPIKKRRPFSAEVVKMLDIPNFLRETTMDRADDIDDDIQLDDDVELDDVVELDDDEDSD